MATNPSSGSRSHQFVEELCQGRVSDRWCPFDLNDLGVLIKHGVAELTRPNIDHNGSFSQQLIEIVCHAHSPRLDVSAKLNATACALLGISTTPASASVLH